MTRRIIAAIFSFALLAAVPGALAQTEVQVGEGGAGLGDLVMSFANGRQVDGTFHAADPNEFFNPFGGDVVLNGEVLPLVEMGQSLGLVINPNPFPVPRDIDLDGTLNDVGPGLRLGDDPTTLGGVDDQLLGDPADVDGDGVLDKDVIAPGGVYSDGFLPPSVTGGGLINPIMTLEQLAVTLAEPTLRQAAPGEVFLGDIPFNGPADQIPGAAAMTLENGGTVRVSDQLLIIPTMNGPTPIAGQTALLTGTQVTGPLSIFDCENALVEYFTGLVLRGFPSWTPQSFAPLDSFAQLAAAIVTRCLPGEGWQPAELLVNQGPNFQSEEAHTIGFISPRSTMQLTAGNNVAGAEGWTFGAFATKPDRPFQDDTVAFMRNAYPGTLPMTTVPHVVGGVPLDPQEWGPFLGGGTHAGLYNFSNGSCQPEQFSGTYEMLHTFDGNNDGVPDVNEESAATEGIKTALVQYTTGQLTLGRTWTQPFRFEVEGSGENYTESYAFENDSTNSGVYTYQPDGGDECTWQFTIDAGLLEMTEEVAVELAAVSAPAPTTTTGAPESTTTTQGASTPGGGETPSNTTTTGASAAPGDSGSDSAGDDDGGGGGGGIFIILIVLAVLAAAAYWAWKTFFGTPPPWTWPCWPEYVAWQQAKKACDEAKKKAAEARKKANEATKAREDAEKKKDDHCKKYPPACRPQSSASSGGRTVTSDDLWIQNQWSAASWTRFRNGDINRQEQQDMWDRPPDADFRKEKQKELDAAKAAIKGLDEAIAAAQKAEAEANAAAEAAEAAAAEACSKAAKAKAAYDACIGAGAAAGQAGADAGGDPGAGGGTPPAGPGGPATAGGGDGGARPDCSQQEAAYNAAQNACDEAQEAADAAQEAADDAEEAAEEARQNLEDYCEEWSANCYDGSIELSGDPSSRITDEDLFARQLWDEHAWDDYQDGEISADELQQRWKDGPPDQFVEDAKRKLGDAKALKPGLDEAVAETEKKAAEAAARAAQAQQSADDACAQAERARKAFEDCVRAAGGA